MKKYCYTILALCLFFASFAQNKGINYQAVIVDPNPIELPGQSISGQPLSNGKVCLRFAILSSDGTFDYIETHSTKTDEFGLVNLVIGNGTSTTSDIVTLGRGSYSDFNSIKWDSKVKSLKVSVSFDDCSSFKEIANQPFNYTPYALYAGAVEYKNVDGAPNNLSQFTNDVGFLISKDLDPIKKDILLTQNNVTNLSDKTESKFLVVNQHLSSLDSTNKTIATKFNSIDGTLVNFDNRINANTNSISQTNFTLNQQVGGLQNQLNSTNATINQLGDSYEVFSNKSIDTNLGAGTPSDTYYPSQKAVKSYVDVNIADAVATGAPDASTLAKGKVKLAGDLGGTADEPTVPSLALKESLSNKSTSVSTDAASDVKYPSVKAVKDYVDGQVTGSTITAGTDTQYYRGDKTWQTLNKSAVGLANVDNTSDANKPVSTATQTALDLKLAKADTLSLSNRIDLKQTLANKSTSVSTDAASDTKYPSVKAVKDYVDGQVTGSAITAGTDTQYYRGDKTWQTLNKSAVGLANVDNTSDANKPVSTATQTALDLKLAKADTLSLSNRIDLKQTLANKSTSVSTDAASDIKYPSVKAVKDYVDGQVTGSTITAGTDTQYYRGDKTWQTLNKSAVGLANVDNTSDANKPVSTATQTALDLKLAKADTLSLSNRIDLKQTLANKSTSVSTDAASDTKYPSVKAVKDYVDGQVTGSAITAGTDTQYYRGDKTWQTLNKSAVGLANVDNTSDANKPVSTATQTALDLKLAKADTLSLSNRIDLKQTLANKSTSVSTDAASDTKYPSVKAVKDYVDTQITNSAISVGSVDSSSRINGATLSSGVLKLAPANETNPGIVTTGNQTFGGIKTFASFILVNNIPIGAMNNDFGHNLLFGENVYRNLTSGYKNIAFGFEALFNVNSGKNNVGVGNSSLSNLSSGSENVAVGNYALNRVNLGRSNTAIGSQAGIGIYDDEWNNTFLGARADVYWDYLNDRFRGRIGNITNATAIGYYAQVRESNTIQLGNYDITKVFTRGKLVSGDITYPNTDGLAGQLLATDGYGNISWTNKLPINYKDFSNTSDNPWYLSTDDQGKTIFINNENDVYLPDSYDLQNGFTVKIINTLSGTYLNIISSQGILNYLQSNMPVSNSSSYRISPFEKVEVYFYQGNFYLTGSVSLPPS